jgi:hypothetical protein
MINKYIINSEYTDTVYYEARWFTSLENYNYYKTTCEDKMHSDACDSCHWEETFPYEEPSISKRFFSGDSIVYENKKMSIYEMCTTKYGYDWNDHFKLFDPSTDKTEWQYLIERENDMHLCIQDYIRGICGYYVQLRIVWKDKNGQTDWSEWTKPYNIRDISGADAICKS